MNDETLEYLRGLKADELEHIAYMQTLEILSLNAHIAELEEIVDKLIEAGDALESQAYVAWRKYGMLDFPAAETWCALVKDWKERER